MNEIKQKTKKDEGFWLFNINIYRQILLYSNCNGFQTYIHVNICIVQESEAYERPAPTVPSIKLKTIHNAVIVGDANHENEGLSSNVKTIIIKYKIDYSYLL